MHNLITERTPAAPWRRRNAGLVRASRCSFGWVPAGHVRCSSQSQILVRNGVFGGYGRAQTQNDGRTLRKLVDKDRNAVGGVRMRVGRGSRYHPIRVACVFYGSESHGLFWRRRPPAARTPSRTAAARPPAPPRAAAHAFRRRYVRRHGFFVVRWGDKGRRRDIRRCLNNQPHEVPGGDITGTW